MIEPLYDVFKRWSYGGSIYIISDTHFDDPQCKEIDPNWPEPNEYIIGLKKTVTTNDTLIHLGDVGNPEYLDSLKCHKVLVMGNHDCREKCDRYFDEIYDGPLYISKKILLSHEKVHAWGAVNIHGHEHHKVPGVQVDIEENNSSINLASDVCGHVPMNLGVAIKNGLLSSTKDIHRITIDHAKPRSK